MKENLQQRDLQKADSPTEPILTIRVECGEASSVMGYKTDIVMIPFTAVASGRFFTGKTVGTGVDTQKIAKGGEAFLSARYMLEGEDFAGNKCRIFIENQGNFRDGFKPMLVTDSPVLRDWECAEFLAEIEPAEGGVIIKIFKEG